MGAKYTVAQKKATDEYMKDKHVIRVITTKEKASEYKKDAETEGKSLSQFMIDAAEYYKKSMIN